jgi:tetratricopeptide (TPR) repeat protein
VDTLLTGSFIKDGDDLRITAQLIDAKLDKILWRDSIDVKYDKLLTVQDRVSQQIIKELEVNLSPREAENLKPEKPISAVAYEYYLRGIDLYSLNEFSAAIEMLQKSTAVEPTYAPAWANLGRAYTTNASLQFGGREDYGKAQAAYEKAIALNPALVEPRIYMANLLTDTGRVEQAVPLLRSVLRDSPNNAEAHWELGYAYRYAGMLEESVAESEKARHIDPLVKINSSAMNSYLYLGEYQKFLQSLPAKDFVYIIYSFVIPTSWAILCCKIFMTTRNSRIWSARLATGASSSRALFSKTGWNEVPPLPNLAHIGGGLHHGLPGLQENASSNSGMLTTTPLMR